MLKDETDADIACMLRQICEYMFEGKDNRFDEQKFNVIWADLKDILSLQRQEMICGKKASKYDRLWRHFAFKKSYYDKLKLMNLKTAERISKQYANRHLKVKSQKIYRSRQKSFIRLQGLRWTYRSNAKRQAQKAEKQRLNQSRLNER